MKNNSGEQEMEGRAHLSRDICSVKKIYTKFQMKSIEQVSLMIVFGGFLLRLVAKKTPKDALAFFCLSCLQFLSVLIIRLGAFYPLT